MMIENKYLPAFLQKSVLSDQHNPIGDKFKFYMWAMFYNNAKPTIG